MIAGRDFVATRSSCPFLKGCSFKLSAGCRLGAAKGGGWDVKNLLAAHVEQ